MEIYEKIMKFISENAWENNRVYGGKFIEIQR